MTKWYAFDNLIKSIKKQARPMQRGRRQSMKMRTFLRDSNPRFSLRLSYLALNKKCTATSPYKLPAHTEEGRREHSERPTKLETAEYARMRIHFREW